MNTEWELAPCGYCPLCGAPGVSRRPRGPRPGDDFDVCSNYHVYPSEEAVSSQAETSKPPAQVDTAKEFAALRDEIASLRGLILSLSRQVSDLKTPNHSRVPPANPTRGGKW